MEEQKATIYVGGLSFDSDEQALHKFFLRYGEVKSTKVSHRATDQATSFVQPACGRELHS